MKKGGILWAEEHFSIARSYVLIGPPETTTHIVSGAI
jgi:hypothetical protein